MLDLFTQLPVGQAKLKAARRAWLLPSVLSNPASILTGLALFSVSLLRKRAIRLVWVPSIRDRHFFLRGGVAPCPLLSFWPLSIYGGLQSCTLLWACHSVNPVPASSPCTSLALP